MIGRTIPVSLTAVVLAAALVHAPTPFLAVIRAQPAPEHTPAVDPGDAASAQVRELSGILSDPSATQQQRDEAARRIADRPSPQSKQALLGALQSPQNVGAQIAVARALADQQNPDPDFISPLFAAIGSNRTLTEDAAAALSNYKSRPEVQQRLIDISGRRAPPEWIRYAAIKALGAFPEKRAAESLMRLLRNPEESANIRNRAADALASISGINDYGQDLALWEQWWAQASRRDDTSFRDEIMNRKASQHDRDEARIGRLTEQLQAALAEQYQAAAAEQKEPLLLRFLRSDEPAERIVGVDQASRDFLGTRPVPASVREQIRSMIGDSNNAVRKAVAVALKTLNDAPSLDAMLQQLTIETDPGVRAEMAKAIGKLAADSQQETRAAPVLMRLLASGSPEVASAAASALQDIGPQLPAKDPALARQVAVALRGILDRTAHANNAADIDLRRAAVEALGPLKQRDLVSVFLPMLDPRREHKDVRIAVLHALRDLAERPTADTIVGSLNDGDDDVVQAAIEALGTVAPGPDQLEALRPLLDPANRRAAAIRDSAWRVIESSMPQMREVDLSQWAHRFGEWNELQRQILVLKQLAAKLTADKKLNDLAVTQQQIADASVVLKDMESAVTYYKLALDYYLGQNARGLQLESVINAYQRALLESGKYADAIAFTQQMLAQDPTRQQLASAIRAYADSLVQSGKPEDLRKAADLIEQALKMQPPLASQYVSQLEDIRQDINKKLNESSPPATGPRSANGSSQPVPATREVKVAGDGGG